MRLHRFHGGLDLPGHKAESTAAGIRRCALAPQLTLPLAQHAGAPAMSIVEAGQRVRRGDCIAVADGAMSAALHAPASGVVRAILRRALPRAGLPIDDCIVLDTDEGAAPEVPSGRAPPVGIEALERLEAGTLRQRIRDAGIVGLGGAGFPTAEKLAHPRHVLVLNGAECEPWIACDDALLRERADDVVRGARLLARCVDAGRMLLAIEDSMPQALEAARAAVARHAPEVEIVVVPTRYPEGGERQLIRVLLGIEVPRGGLPRDLGVLVHNVGTAAACWRALACAEPLLSRIVSVTGPGVAQPGNFEAPIGTPIAWLVAQAGGYTRDAARLLLGGPMMGLALPHDDFPLCKPANCVLVLGAEALPPAAAPMPCIRCGECSRVCPAQLLPQQMHWHLRAEAPDRARALGLFDCIECGCCDLVCPSQLPLTQQFRRGKVDLRQQDLARLDADAARDRHEARQSRLARDADEEKQQRAARQQAAASPDAVQAALARARARREQGDKP